jgi:hypothetical protein
MTVVILPFFVTDRYRHHLVPAAFVLAALALAALVAAWRQRPQAGRSLAALAVGLAVGAVVVHLPAPGLSPAKLEWGIAADLAARYLARGDVPRALSEFERRAIRRSAHSGAARACAGAQRRPCTITRAGSAAPGGSTAARAFESRSQSADNAQIRAGWPACARAGPHRGPRQYEAMGGWCREVAGALGRAVAAQAGGSTRRPVPGRRDRPAPGDVGRVGAARGAGRVAAAGRRWSPRPQAGETTAPAHRALVLVARRSRGAAAWAARARSAGGAPAWAGVDRVVERLLAVRPEIGNMRACRLLPTTPGTCGLSAANGEARSRRSIPSGMRSIVPPARRGAPLPPEID